jgi:hypothetical protein
MVRTDNLVVNVSYVRDRCKKHFDKKAQVAGTKQSRKAVKADWMTRWTG